MRLTPQGAHAVQLGLPERRALADQLMSGRKNITEFTSGVCYDTVAFVRYLLNAGITPNEVTATDGGAWKIKFAFERGHEWDGATPIAKGTAVGFKRPVGFTAEPDKFFHAAVATGGTRVRGVNGGLLSPGWPVEVDLRQVLTTRNDDGSFKYDNADIRVYLSAF
jgi:hypothetical protein